MLAGGATGRIHLGDDGKSFLVLVAVDRLHDVRVIETREHLQFAPEVLLQQGIGEVEHLAGVLAARVLVDDAPNDRVRSPGGQTDGRRQRSNPPSEQTDSRRQRPTDK